MSSSEEIDSPGEDQAASEPQDSNPHQRMRYLQGYYFVFDHPKWMSNLLHCTICAILPFIGLLVFMGYEYQLIENTHRDSKKRYDLFQWSNFSDYLTRGIWPWLISMLVGMIVQPFLFVLLYVAGIACYIIARVVGEEYAGLVLAIGIPLITLFAAAAIFLMHFFMIPMMLRAGLSQNFGDAFKLGWVRDFIKKMWFELTMMILFTTVTSVLLMFLGLAICCIGAAPAMTLVMFAQAHLTLQLYEIFLARGGDPVPLKEPATS